MPEDLDMMGGEADALAMLLGGGVGGVDYVGAAPNFNPALLQQLHQVRPQAQLQVTPQHRAVLSAGLKALKFAARVQHDRKLRNAALSGYVPQTIIPVSTAVGSTIAAGAAFTLSGSAGVPCRITKYVVDPISASFFGLSSIVAARMSMFAGGTGLVPASRFLPTAVQTPIDNPELGAGAPVVVAGQNISLDAHLFISSFDAIDRTSPTARIT